MCVCVYLWQRSCSLRCGSPPVRLRSAVCAADSACDKPRTPGRLSEQYAWLDSGCVGRERGKKRKKCSYSQNTICTTFPLPFGSKHSLLYSVLKPKFKRFIQYWDEFFFSRLKLSFRRWCSFLKSSCNPVPNKPESAREFFRKYCPDVVNQVQTGADLPQKHVCVMQNTCVTWSPRSSLT